MMPTRPESPRLTYRAARRAFIAACEKAHIDTVARLHPSKGPDGKPLFMDCTALGPRHAERAVLLVGHDAAGTDLLIQLLGAVAAPKDARLVLVHAFDPARFAGVPGDAAWPHTMLGAVATEDLSHVRELTVMSLMTSLAVDGGTLNIQEKLPQAAITILPPVSDPAKARDAINAFFAA
jgi:hypothetical protein